MAEPGLSLPTLPLDEVGAPTDDLLTRRGLPEAFRYLENACPRVQPTARHWLEVHDWFRGNKTALGEIGALGREDRIEAADYRG